MSQSADETTVTPAPSLPGTPTGPTAAHATAVDTIPDPTAAPSPPAEGPAGATHLSLDGELPRLAAAPSPSVPPEQRSTSTRKPDGAPVADAKLELPTLPTLPTAAPVITGPDGIPAPDQRPASSSATSPSNDTNPSEERAPGADHPMAHLMPQRSTPSEASRRAADIRAAKKAKARKVKIAVAAGTLVVVAVVGPPLGRWLADAVNEAGNTSTEEPAG